MVVELLHFDFPLDTARVFMVDLHRKIAALIELSERRVGRIWTWSGSLTRADAASWSSLRLRRRGPQRSFIPITAFQEVLW